MMCIQAISTFRNYSGCKHSFCKFVYQWFIYLCTPLCAHGVCKPTDIAVLLTMYMQYVLHSTMVFIAKYLKMYFDIQYCLILCNYVSYFTISNDYTRQLCNYEQLHHLVFSLSIEVVNSVSRFLYKNIKQIVSCNDFHN